MQDPRLVSSPYVCTQVVLIPNEYVFFNTEIPMYVESDILFQNGLLCSKKAVYLLQSTTATRVVGVGVGVGVHAQDIPNWNILFG